MNGPGVVLQAYDPRVNVKESVRRQFQDDLISNSALVLAKLGACVPSVGQGEQLKRILRCFMMWLRYTGVRASVVASCGLLPVVFRCTSCVEVIRSCSMYFL